jgi:hypothetical protein
MNGRTYLNQLEQEYCRQLEEVQRQRENLEQQLQVLRERQHYLVEALDKLLQQGNI